MPPKNKSTEDESLEPQCKKHRPEVVENEENFPTTDEKHKSTDNGAEENSVSEENSDAEKGNKKSTKEENEEEPCGVLLLCGATNWDLAGRKELPKSTKNLGGPNLWEPHIISTLSGIRIRHISSGPSACHSVIITESGTAMSFGRNDKGQLGHGTTDRCDKPTIIERLKYYNIIQASCGKNHSLVLTDDGKVFGFGENKLGQLGQGHQKAVLPHPIQVMHPNNKSITKVSCGSEFSMFLDEESHLYSFGSPEHGQLGHNTDGQYIVASNKLGYQCELLPRKLNIFVERNRDGFVNVIEDVKLVDIACGNQHTMARDGEGRVFTWGFGGYGRLGHQQPKDEHVPRLLTFFNNRGTISAMHAGAAYSMCVCQGQLYFWGQTKLSGEAAMYPKPVQDLSGWKIRSVGCSKTSIVVAADESIVSWGPSPTSGELGYGLKKGGSKSSTRPQIVEPLEGVYVHSVACGLSHSLFIARDDKPEDKDNLSKVPVYTPTDV